MDQQQQHSSHGAFLSSSSRSGGEQQPHNDDHDLAFLCSKRKWDCAAKRARSHPEEASPSNSSTKASPLALACRKGATANAISAILDAAPKQLRKLLVARGTPLHEAIVNESIGVDVVQLLLKTDEQLAAASPEQVRACLMQDVDGHTPLHLLIRRRSTMHVLNGSDAHWNTLLDMLVKSCPEAVGVPDRGEYAEPPLVMALKASLYAGGESQQEPGDDYVRTERSIHEMVRTMLRHNPDAAAKVLEGARGNYTAIHSAVFHGRCCDTIQLLLEAKRDSSPALLLANTQGELPLHFATMRGESPKSVKLLAQAAPEAVLKRDVSGLTPMHWLWIRFVSTLMVLDEKQQDSSSEDTILEIERPTSEDTTFPYTAYWIVEKGEFFADLNLIRRLDPPVDFLRMRHIPPELFGPLAPTWAERSVEALSVVRERRIIQRLQDGGEWQRMNLDWTRMEAVTSLFWTKVVSLLRVAGEAHNDDDDDDDEDVALPPPPFRLLHTAMSTYSCPSQVALMTTLNFPEELGLQDHHGRLPLHCAAMRKWHHWDCQGRPTGNELENAAEQLLRGESLAVLQHCLDVSPTDASRVPDHDGKLVLHHAIETFVTACSSRMMDRDAVQDMLGLIQQLLVLHPESLERRDPQTMLFPFQQATAAATSRTREISNNTNTSLPSSEMSLSISYHLLRENPLLVVNNNSRRQQQQQKEEVVTTTTAPSR